MSSIALLLSPLWLSWKNGFLRGGASWPRRLVLAALAAGFWLGTFLVIRRVLRYFETVFDLGPGLAYQLLLIILLTFLSMLLFSNLVASLSTFFLARDLELLHSTPIAPRSFFYARLINTTVNSSWMVLFFSLPIFAAYVSVFAGGLSLYLWDAGILPLYLVIPAAISIRFRALVDDSVAAIHVNGVEHMHPSDNTQPFVFSGASAWQEFILTDHFQVGTNTITFTVYNITQNMGLRVEWLEVCDAAAIP